MSRSAPAALRTRGVRRQGYRGGSRSGYLGHPAGQFAAKDSAASRADWSNGTGGLEKASGPPPRAGEGIPSFAAGDHHQPTRDRRRVSDRRGETVFLQTRGSLDLQS